MVPLDFKKDYVIWVIAKLFGNTGFLGAEMIDLRNWFIIFGCASEELRIFVTKLSEWMANSYPYWASYHELMPFRLVALDKILGMRPVGISETLHWSLDKIVIRAARDQAKTYRGNLQICAGLEARI